MRSSRRAAFAAILLVLFSPGAARPDERAAAKLYDELRAEGRLEPFLRAFPKGGDLHNHLGGALTPEEWIDIAIRHDFCLDDRLLILAQKPASTCPAGMAPASTLRNGGAVYSQLVDALSMRGNRGGPEKGHDHFFQAFNHFRVPDPAPLLGELLEAVVVRASRQNIAYLELQISPFGWAGFTRDAGALPPDGSMSQWLDTLDHSKAFRDVVEYGKGVVQRGESELRKRRPAEAAAVHRRYLITAGRNSAPQHVFVQLAVAAELARVQPLVVGVNLAGPEDGAVSLRDFRQQMRMLAFLRAHKPWMRVTLHAGELTPRILGAAPGVVPEALTFHIGESVRTARAERIGHGTALRYEKDRDGLLAVMRERGVLAEICLTSEAVIQALPPGGIPLAEYREAGVPVSLNTDDEGVLGTDLSREFLRAASDYHLHYTDLKQLARNSIEYSFLPGQGLFRTREFKAWVPACADAADSRSCRAYLKSNPKAEAALNLEQQFRQFESSASLRRFQVRSLRSRLSARPQ